MYTNSKEQEQTAKSKAFQLHRTVAFLNGLWLADRHLLSKGHHRPLSKGHRRPLRSSKILN